MRGQNLASGYASVDATRSTAAPSLDQYHTPATAWGGNAIARMPLGQDLSLDAGIDGRDAEMPVPSREAAGSQAAPGAGRLDHHACRSDQ